MAALCIFLCSRPAITGVETGEFEGEPAQYFP